MKTHYRTIWISDAHLCSRDCRAEDLLNMLRHSKFDYLYLVGDFIDVWQLKRGWYWPDTFNNIIHQILKRARKGARVLYVPGNHDECVREYAGFQFGGIQICRRAIHITADGKRLLVLHGDEFDAVVQCHRWLAVLGSAAYDYLVSLNRVVNAVRRLLGWPYWSLAASVKVKVKEAVSYVCSFESAVVHEARKGKLDGVVCGHIHQAAAKNFDGIEYYNCGDWVESCTALVETDAGELKLIRWLDLAKDLAPQGEPDEEEAELVGAGHDVVTV